MRERPIVEQIACWLAHAEQRTVNCRLEAAQHDRYAEDFIWRDREGDEWDAIASLLRAKLREVEARVARGWADPDWPGELPPDDDLSSDPTP